MKKLRVGFLIDDLQPNQYVIDLIDFVCKQDKYFEAMGDADHRIYNLKPVLTNIYSKIN